MGECLGDRYLVLKKLGWGAFSTVWFAHDTQVNKFVALKVQKSGDSYYSAAEDEIEILELIAKEWETAEWKDFASSQSGGTNINSCNCL